MEPLPAPPQTSAPGAFRVGEAAVGAQWRLLRAGAHVLSDPELLSILCHAGRSEAATLRLARKLLDEHGGLAGLMVAGPENLRQSGLGKEGLAVLLATRELACRLAQGQISGRAPLLRPAETVRYLHLRYHLRDQEVFGALFLDLQRRLITDREIFRGTLARAAVEPREILKQALLCGAAGVVLFHTHPSGNPSPSAEDLLFTRRMADAAEILGIELLDHLVIGSGDCWVSLKERGPW